MIVDNLKALCKQKGVTFSQFERESGVGKNTANRWDDISPSVRKVKQAADYFGVTVSDILGEHRVTLHPTPHPFAELFDTAAPEVQDAVLTLLRATQSARSAPRVQTIRHYLSRPAAGVDGLVEGEDYEDIPLPPNAPQNADYCVTISGHSMEPYLHDGELAFVDRDAPLNDFEVGVFTVDGALYIKQFVREYGGIVQLLSANREYDDITILPSGNQSFAYWGKVLTGKIPPPKA